MRITAMPGDADHGGAAMRITAARRCGSRRRGDADHGGAVTARSDVSRSMRPTSPPAC
jgi:hypothetical protein